MEAEPLAVARVAGALEVEEVREAKVATVREVAVMEGIQVKVVDMGTGARCRESWFPAATSIRTPAQQKVVRLPASRGATSSRCAQ